MGGDVYLPAARTLLGAAPPSSDVLLDGPPVAVWKVPASAGREYAAVSGDHNPIHTSWLGARAFGFPRPIAHGMWTLARLLAVRPATSVAVEFRAPIFLGAHVELRNSELRSELRSKRVHLRADFS